jgi:hypothetical protein
MVYNSQRVDLFKRLLWDAEALIEARNQIAALPMRLS